MQVCLRSWEAALSAGRKKQVRLAQVPKKKLPKRRGDRMMIVLVTGLPWGLGSAFLPDAGS